MLAKLETELPPINSMMETLGELRQECRKLNLRLAQAALDRFGDTLGTLGGKTPVEIAGVLKPFVYDLNLRVWDELKDTSFLLIQPEHAKLYKQGEPIFGSDVDNKFPVMSEDISEAAKCIALSRYTAAVFHLSRAMEAAVVRLGEALSVTVLDKNNVELEWGKIISNLSSPIEKRSVVIRICLAHPHQNGVA